MSGRYISISEKTITFKCTPERCLYNDPEYKIYGVVVNSFDYPDVKIGRYGTATIVGNIHELTWGSEYEIKGIEKKDKYGYKYEVTNIRRPKPSTPETSRQFLYEILTANQTDTLLEAYPDIIDRVINDRLDDIDLSKTYNIKEYTFEVIKRKIIENFKLADLVEEFGGYFSFSVLKKLYDKYASIEKIKEEIINDPYKCLCDLSGIGFKTADEMLLKISSKHQNDDLPLNFGVDLKTSIQRMRACINYVLDENEKEGNTYISLKTLKNRSDVLTKECIEHFPTIIKETDNIFFDKELLRVSRTLTYQTELYIKEKIGEGLSNSTIWDVDVSKYRQLKDFTISDDQTKTLEYICKYNLVILNGFAGSGKSSSTQALIGLLDDIKKSYMLVAPTGRAAKVISNYTGRPASTIHRGLNFIPPNEWLYNEDCPLRVDVVILDESSMTDIFLMKRLLAAIDFTKTKLLMIGDDAQIPSVGAGNVLYDLLNCGKIPTVTLNKIFRYGEGGIMTAATDTRMSNEYLDRKNNDVQVFGGDKSYTYLPIQQEKAVGFIVKLYQKLLSEGYNVEDIGILSCYNVKDYGTENINNKIQEVINSETEHIKYGEIEYRLNDLVIQCVNNYKALIYPECEVKTFIPNGEIGKIVQISGNNMVIDFDGTQIYYNKSNLSQVKLAYAISTHKSQGGQFKVIILLTPKAHTFMLNSNLLYVGMTRAKEKCYHIGEMDTINKAIKKKENFDRKTYLRELLA